MGNGISQACYNSIAVPTNQAAFTYTVGTMTTLSFPITFSSTSCKPTTATVGANSRPDIIDFKLYNYVSSSSMTEFSDCSYTITSGENGSGTAVCTSPQTVGTGSYVFGVTESNEENYSYYVTSGSDHLTNVFTITVKAVPPTPTGGTGTHRRAKIDAQRIAQVNAGKVLETLPNGTPCPSGTSACPLLAMRGGKTTWGCMDYASDLDSCGGCPGTRASIDCTMIPFVNDVHCLEGKCVVHSCERGYVVAPDGMQCIRLDDLK